MTKFEFETKTKCLTCILDQRLDTQSCVGLEESIRLEMAKNHPGDDFLELKVTFDMKQVDYVSSAFLRICVVVAKMVKKGNFSISNTNPFVKKTFKIAGFDNIFTIS